jgi:hypothetical protein
MFARHGLDITAENLAAELARPLEGIDRSLPGFEDLAWEAVRGIEPGQPAHSLLFHALASPQVLTSPSKGDPLPLEDFPTPAEIEAVENYVYGAQPPSIEELRVLADGAHLAIAVFASEYRPAIGTVHRRHADMCYSRTGVARVGTEAPDYLPKARGYLPFVMGDGRRIRALPCRYSAYIAALLPGKKGGHGPVRFIEAQNAPAAQSSTAPHKDDEARSFWIPVHKLFDGDECIRDRTLSVVLSANHINERLRRAHLFFLAHGHNGGWCEPDISNPPFRCTDGIAGFEAARDRDGSWLLVPEVHPRLIEPAQYDGKPLTYIVPETKSDKDPWRPYPRLGGSSLNLKPPPSEARTAPEYLHARHRIDGPEKETDLNKRPDMPDIVKKGGYRARHYVDYTGDGWIAVACSELALEVPRRLAAYSIVSSPDFLPAVKQSDLMEWTEQSVAPSLLETIWPESPGKPQALSDQRFAANLELDGAHFDASDDTMTAIVGNAGSGTGRLTQIERELELRASTLPDAAAGVFAPGWDVAYDRTSEVDESGTGSGLRPGTTFLNSYGLGSPFVEDSKLCAALSSFWPAAAPDITRTFEPSRRYATATPLPDEVIGLGSSPPWDGIRGPRVDHQKKEVEYTALSYADYVQAALDNAFNITQIGETTLDDYVARTLTMALVYQALGATKVEDKVKWVLLSFRKTDPDDADLHRACDATKKQVNPEFTFRFEMFEHKGEIRTRRNKVGKRFIDLGKLELIFADPTVVLRRTEKDDWVAS